MKDILSKNRNKIKAVFKLIRFPNTFTAIADSISGYFLIADFQRMDFRILFLLSVISFTFYASGIVINDLFDYKKDSVSHPYRPLPSGAVKISEAIILIFILIIAGLSASLMVGRKTFFVAVFLGISIFMYDKTFKKGFFVPGFFMGLCRFFNFTLGFSVVEWGNGIPGKIWVFPSLLLVYVCIITMISRREKTVTTKKASLWIFTWISISYVLIFCYNLVNNYLGIMYLLVFFLLMIKIKIKSCNVDKLLKWLILGIIFYDASFVAFYKGISISLYIVIISIPAILLSRSIKMT